MESQYESSGMVDLLIFLYAYCFFYNMNKFQDPIYQRTRELLALQEQLQRQVDECRYEANARMGNQTARLASPLH